MSLSSATQEAVWLKMISDELFPRAASTIVMIMNCDNKSAICLASNQMYSKRTKHISIKYHFVREKVADGSIVLKYIPTDQMLADVLTKIVSPIKTELLSSKFGLVFK